MATIQRTDEPGKYKARVSLGSDSAGTRRIKTKVFHGNERAVRKAVAIWEAEVRSEAAWPTPEPEPDPDQEDDPRGPTFAAVLRSYIDVTAAAKEWTDDHRADRQRHLDDITESDLGAVRMTELRRTDLAAHLTAYAGTPTIHGKKRGKASVRQRKIVLAAAVRYAINDPDIEVRGNPAADLVTKDTGRKVAEREIPTVAEWRPLIDAGAARMDELARAARQCRPGHPHRGELIRDLARFALVSGMRRAEISGLRTTDVTYEAQPDGSTTATILVRWTTETLAGGGWRLKRTKTEHHRTIQVGAEAADILLRRQAANTARALEDDVTPPAAGFIFSRGWGEAPIMPDAITHWWARLRELEPGIDPELRFQDLRHACASHLHSLGFHPAAVAAFMGHSTEVSLGTYDHVRPGTFTKMAKALDEAAVI